MKSKEFFFIVSRVIIKIAIISNLIGIVDNWNNLFPDSTSKSIGCLSEVQHFTEGNPLNYTNVPLLDVHLNSIKGPYIDLYCLWTIYRHHNLH